MIQVLVLPDSEVSILCGYLQGVQLELFTFDTFPLAQQVSLMKVDRDSDFPR